MKNFNLDAIAETQTVPNAGTGVQFTVPAGATDILIHNPGPDVLYVRAGGENVVANGTGADFPIALPSGFMGPLGVFGCKKVAARFDTTEKSLTVWFGLGQ